MKVVREEIFGPVVCASPITDADLEAIASQANNTNYGLAASVWTRDISKANKLAKRIRAGTVWINCHNVSMPRFRSAATRSLAGAARWANSFSTTTLK